MAESEKERVSKLVNKAVELFNGKRIEWWQIKNPPSEERLADFSDIEKPRTSYAAERREDYQRRKYWEARARRLLADPRSTRNDLETAERGTRHNAELNEQLRERRKVTKK
jgi:hypothetical protein